MVRLTGAGFVAVLMCVFQVNCASAGNELRAARELNVPAAVGFVNTEEIALLPRSSSVSEILAAAVQVNPDTNATHLRIARSNDLGVSWTGGDLNLVELSNIEVIRDPRLAGGDGLGGVIAVVTRGNSSSQSIQAWHSQDFGSTWSGPETLSEPGETIYSSPSVLSDGQGTFIVCWSGINGIQLRRCTDLPSFQWSPPVTVAADVSLALEPQLATDFRGTWLLGFYGIPAGGGFDSLYSVSTDHGLNWSATRSLVGSASVVAQPRYAPSFTYDKETALWYGAFINGDGVWSVRSSDGGVDWDIPVKISLSVGSYLPPSLNIDPSGTVMAAWDWSFEETVYTSFATSTDQGMAWSEPLNVNGSGLLPSSGGSFVHPQISQNRFGHGWLSGIFYESGSEHGTPLMLPFDDMLPVGSLISSVQKTQIAGGSTGSQVLDWYYGPGTIRISPYQNDPVHTVKSVLPADWLWKGSFLYDYGAAAFTGATYLTNNRWNN